MANNSESKGEIHEKIREEIKEPDQYRILLHNDHYTTMEFVVEILRGIFHKTLPEATQIMLDVHKKGRGIVGVYTYDIARTRIDLVDKLSRENEFPLKCTMEKA
ncbi:MAG: ATP-dependent Clp protease adapter ClpS [Spirochaetales bacterium]|nr:ATP-dependent Clp protease adapter ClpS [Spirochaetales bacterium]